MVQAMPRGVDEGAAAAAAQAEAGSGKQGKFVVGDLPGAGEFSLPLSQPFRAQARRNNPTGGAQDDVALVERGKAAFHGVTPWRDRVLASGVNCSSSGYLFTASSNV